MAFDPKHLDQFPAQPGVYLMKNREGNVIYVGKAKHLKNRIKQYFSPSGDNREMIPFLTAQIVHIDTLIVPSEKEALLLKTPSSNDISLSLMLFSKTIKLLSA